MNDLHSNQGIPPDDPRVTAYALGELQGEDAALIEQRLAGDAALRKEVESIRTMGASLREGFAAEPVAGLTEAQRGAIMRQPEVVWGRSERDRMRMAASSQAADAPLNSPWIFRLRGRRIAAGLAAAAMLALAVTAAIIFSGHGGQGTNVAIRSPQDQSGSVHREIEPTPTQNGQFSQADGQENEAARMSVDALSKTSPSGDIRAGDLEADRKDKAVSKLDGDAGGVALGNVLQSPGTKGEERRDAAPPAAPPPAPAIAPAQPADQAQPPPSGGAGGFAGGGGGGEVGQPRRGGNAPKESAPPERARDAQTPVKQGPARPGNSTAAPASEASMPGAIGGRSLDTGAPSPASAQAPTPAPSASEPTNAAANPAERSASGGNLRAAPAGRVRVLSDDEIRRMDESELKASIASTSKQRQESRDPRAETQLRRQAQRLNERLKELQDDAERNAEEYARLADNPFVAPTGDNALSTFSADVDTASYSNIRRFLNEGRLPPPDAVRIEEMVNYFRYAYEPASGDKPFGASIEVAPAPWNSHHRLVRVGLRAREVRMDMRPPTSLVFLVDVSGSMNQAAKLPLVKDALKMLVRQLNGDDLLGIVTYAGNAGVPLESCYVNAENRAKIEAVIDGLSAGGGTNGAGGIGAAYDLATRHFIKGGVNRVILCTDGDFNVGVSSDDDLVHLIEAQRKSNVFLSVLGFGTGNLKDGKMEKLSNAGNGNFAYIDSQDEARRVLIEQMGGTLVTVAKDVKFQVRFNDEKVAAYRLIGYEDRLLAAADFDNDRKDAGEIGSGHTVTALYEVVPVGADDAAAFAEAPAPAPAGAADARDAEAVGQPASRVEAPAKKLPAGQLLEINIRYKSPAEDVSSLLSLPVNDDGKSLQSASADFRFAAAVAEFGMLLRHSPHKGDATYARVLDLAEGALGEDRDGYRKQFMSLVRAAQTAAAK